MRETKLYDVLDMTRPGSVLDEVILNLTDARPELDSRFIRNAFDTAVSLYQGRYPGYQACNTEYHDLRHTIETFLAMGRLVHGAVICGEKIPDILIRISMAATVLHDAGYIQAVGDTEGTGAKYTAKHVQRSAEFFETYGRSEGLPEKEIRIGQAMILCTDLALKFSDIPFSGPEAHLLGRLLGAADLLAQMADRTYLEKLLFLYHEFREAGVGGFESEMDLLAKTIAFYGFIETRLSNVSEMIDRFLTAHFQNRWGIGRNLYRQAIDRQKEYLTRIMNDSGSDPRERLKRQGIVEKVKEKYGPDA